MAEQLPPVPQHDVFVPKDREEGYLRRHNIELRRLSNGATIVGIPRVAEDVAEAEVQFNFPAGSFHDPKGKEGIHHMMEHLIMNPLGEAPERMNVNLNAHTFPQAITVEASGIANPDVREYGLWPMLPLIAKQLKRPLEEIKDLPRVLKKEIDVVIGEIEESEADDDREAGKFVRECLYDPSNPLRTDGIGTEAGLKSVTVEEVLELAQNVFIPRGLVAGLITEGRVETCKVLTDELERLLSDYPREERRDRKRDTSLLERFNRDLVPRKLFVRQSLHNRRATAMMVWRFPVREFTPEAIALDRLLPLVQHKLFNYFRDNGMGYTAGVHSEDSPNHAVSFLELKLPNKFELPTELQKDIYPAIRANVFGEITADELAAINIQEEMIQRAVPMPVGNRLHLLMQGLENHGRIIDADAVKDMYRQVTPKHLADWRDKFLQTEPVFIIT